MALIPTAGLAARFLGSTIATGAGFAFGRAAGPILSPPLQRLRNEMNERYAFVPLSPQAAAEAALVGAELPEGYAKEAAKSGVNAQRFAALRAITGTGPPFELLRTWRNRGRIGDDDVRRGLAQAGVRPEWHDDYLSLRFQRLTAQELAQLTAQGLIAEGDAQELAEGVNVAGDTFGRYVALARRPPDTAQLLDLRNRGALTEDQLRAGLRRAGLAPEYVADVSGLRRYLLPPSDVIRLAVHEVYSPARRAALNLDAEFPEAFAQRAARLGIERDDAEDLWAGHWDLPSYSQGAEMLFRGEITGDQFEGLLAALDYAPTWRDKLAAIARRIPTMSDFQRLARREVYNPAQRAALDLDAEFPASFAAKAALHGMSEADARDLWAGGWRLPSATQGFRMLWRDEINEAELGQLLKALDYAPTWRDKLAAIARPTLGRIDIRRALAARKLTPAQGVARYQRLGLTRADAELMVDLATASTTSNVRELTAEQLTAEYEGGFLTADEYAAQLEQLNFAPEELAMYRQLGDARRVAAARRQTLNTIRAAFVGHRLAEAEARAQLDATGLEAETRERLWAEWQMQEAANVRVLTPTQIRKLYSNADLTVDEALAELESRGFSRQSAERMLRL